LLLITVNGPGEVCYSLHPFLEALRSITEEVRVWVIIPPCQFAGGWEEKAVRSLPLVERIVSSRQVFRFLFLEQVNFPKLGLVLFMGGDLFYAYRLKRKSGYPLWAYGIPPRGIRKVDLFLVRFEKYLENYPPEKCFLVGDLLYSLCCIRSRASSSFFGEGKPRFLFLPGSRPALYPYILPFYSEVASLLRREYYPKASLILGFPEFLELESFVEVESQVTSLFKTVWGHTSSLIEESDFAVMVPGSVNLEVAYRGKKGVVVLPLGKGVEKLPLQGVWGLLDVLPFWGKIVKPRLVERLNQKIRWVSLPNRVFDTEIFPEFRGKITPQEVVRGIKEELQGEGAWRSVLAKGRFSQDAAMRLAGKVCEFLEEQECF